MPHDSDVSRIDVPVAKETDPTTTMMGEVDRISKLADSLERLSDVDSEKEQAYTHARLFAHEVNNLIFGVSGQAQRALISGSKDHELAALQTAAQTGARVAGLCDHFLRTSHTKTNNLYRPPVLFEPLILNSAAFAESCLANHPAIVGGGVRFETVLEAGAWVNSTELLLGQVLLNLYANALSGIRRFAESTETLDGVVRLTWRPLDGGGGELIVEDSGCGFGDPNRVTEPDSQSPSGHGLGLGICRMIVEGFGGRVHIGESAELGGGMVSMVFGQTAE